MLLDIRVRDGDLRPELRDLTERRIHFALERFADRVRDVTVRLEDVNGPRGGLDKRCYIEVSLTPRGHVMAETTDAHFESAVSRAAERIARRLQRKVERRRVVRLRATEPPTGHVAVE